MPSSRPDAERILTLHPAGKQGVNIVRDKYDAMRAALLEVVPNSSDGVLFGDLAGLLAPRLDPAVYPPGAPFIWYQVAVKQDLEARGELEIVPRSRPQRVRRPVD